MKHILTLLIFFAGWQGLSAQLFDDFEDGDLSTAPVWLGMTSSFTHLNGELRSNHNLTNSVFYISCPITGNKTAQWQFDCKFTFKPSSANYIDFVLNADDSNLVNSRNMIFVRLGGSSDEISLYKTNNGVETELIDGKDGLLNQSSSTFHILLLFSNDSLTLKFKKSEDQFFTEAGKVFSVIGSSELYTGFRIRQSTASFFNKHYFDNLYFGDILRDTVGPVCDSVKLLDSSKLICFFNEICDSLSLMDTSNYQINLLKGFISNINVWAKQSVVLEFDRSLIPNQIYEFKIDQVRDIEGNKMVLQRFNLLYSQGKEPSVGDLCITELMVDPEPSAGLPEKEYIEIFNRSKNHISLAGCSINDPVTSIPLPALLIAPDSFVLLYKIPSLNNSSDKLILKTADGEIIDEVHYTDLWYRDEQRRYGGFSLELIDVSKPCIKAENWKASIAGPGGTPGKSNSVKGVLPKDTLAPFITGFTCLKNNVFQLVLSEHPDSNSVLKWLINGKGYSLVLSNSDPDNLTYAYKWPFQPSPDSIYRLSISGYRDCEGNIQMPQNRNVQWPSICRKNELLINEILFNPASGGKDFIELYNHTNRCFDLSEIYIADLEGGLLKNIYPLYKEYKLIQPHQYVLLSEDTDQICNAYNCSNQMALKLQMPKMPTMPDNEGGLVLLNRLNEYIDSVYYYDDWHFALLSDKNGVSLERLSFALPAHLPSNWHSAASVKGYATPSAVNSQIFVPVKTDKYFSLVSQTLSPDLDAHEDLMLLRYSLPAPDYVAAVKIYSVEGRQVKVLCNVETLGSEGLLTWDGLGEASEQLPLGIYIVLVECIHPDGNIIREKLSVVLAARL